MCKGTFVSHEHDDQRRRQTHMNIETAVLLGILMGIALKDMWTRAAKP
jgi:hypothetical protein